MIEPNDGSDENEDFEQEPSGPSKSQRKREAHALQNLGTRLVELKPAQLEKLSLPDDLLNAVRAAQGIPQRGARKRQLQYIGKLMRQIDPEPLQAALETLETGGLTAQREQRDLLQLYDHLLTDEQTALTELFEHYPAADRQHLRQLIRNVQREQQQNKPLKSRRILLHYLRELRNSTE
jgi:ribosome-associated protein